MAQMDVDNKVFQLPISVESAGVVTKTLATADTYVDKNIKVTVTTPDAEFEIKKDASVTATVSTTDTTYTSETETAYPITIAADATAGSVQVGVKTAGFAAATDTVDIEAVDAEQNTKTIYIKEGSISVDGDAEATGTISLTQVGTEPTSGFYVKASAASAATVDVAGWVPAGPAGEGAGEAYYTVKNIAFDNKATAEEYTDISDSAPVLNSNGYLYINEGYIGNSKISLAKLVPDESVIPGVAEGKSDLMYKTVTAYDNDGKLVSGTMSDAELGAITASDASATIRTVEVIANGNNFVINGQDTISGTTSVAITKRGLAETTLSQSGVISGTAAVNATLAKIGLAVDVEDADVEVTPVISKETSSTAQSGDITTTAPTSGRYIAVSTAAIEAKGVVNPTVATEGYGTTDVYSSTGAEIKAGAAASGTYYVPITAGSHEAVAGDPTIVVATATVATEAEATDGFEGNLTAGILSVAPTSGEYITINADAEKTKGSVSGTVTCTATEGYIEAAQQTASISGEVDVTVTAAAPKYIKVYDGTVL